MSPIQLLVPTYRQMLRMLAGLLDKAQEQMPGERAEALLSARLAPDMYPLATQIRFAAYQAQEAVFRLEGETLPDWLHALASEGRDAGEKPGSIRDAKARIEQALSFLDGIDLQASDTSANREIGIELPNGVAFDMTGEQFVRDWALPQFYFHAVTAYDLLRAHGLQIGKADYVPHMFAYLRPGPARQT